ncbi:MAG: hypothetical protein LBF68_08075 [Christensenellaceae bacterium]|jgi:NitT/TauT family transport system substrate-binding protein|nr:hypothetical protein [Christensenellaceae bacterium]
MKKTLVLIVFLLTIIFSVSAFLVGCDSNNNGQHTDHNNSDPKAIQVVAPDGAPLLSMTYLYSENFNPISSYNISYEKLQTADQLTASLMQQTPDFAIAPINICAMMYNNDSGYLFAGVSIWGIMHIVSSVESATLESMKGEIIVAFTKAGTPGITLRSILSQNNIEFDEVTTDTLDDGNLGDKVGILYLTDANLVAQTLTAGEIDGVEIKYALLPEPVATKIATATNQKYTAKVNLQTLWEEKNGFSYPQAGLIFHKRLLESDRAFVDSFISMVELSNSWAKANPTKAGDIAKSVLESSSISSGSIVEAAVNAGRLPLDFQSAVESKSSVSSYLSIIFQSTPTLIGGKLPDDDFYYAKAS